MKRLLLTLCALVLLSGEALASGTVKEPVQAAILPQVSEDTRAALLFDVSDVPLESGMDIRVAVIEWRVAGVPSDRLSEYRLYEVSESWSSEGAGLSAPEYAENEYGDWYITPNDYAKNSGGLIRLDVTDLVRQWIGERPNHGVVISAPSVSEEDLAGSIAEARLVIRMGLTGK